MKEPIIGHAILPSMHLTHRYVYDLGDVVGTLQSLGDYPPEDDHAKAWIVNHLRSYHFLDTDGLLHIDGRCNPSDLDKRCGRWTDGLTRRLYRMFSPMAFEAQEAFFLDMQFQHSVLTIALYSP